MLCATLALSACASAPSDLWLKTHQFPGCPSRPNCVSSVATDEQHRIEPLRYEGDPAAAKAKLASVIESMPRAHIESQDSRYLHAIFTSRLMRFEDDVELLVQPGGRIDVRSASRVGYGDLGVNRARVEEIRKLMHPDEATDASRSR